MKHKIVLSLLLVTLFAPVPVFAEGEGFGARVKEWRETRQHRAATREAVIAAPDARLTKDTFEDREILLHIGNVPAPGRRPMVVVLHGGMGNAGHIQSIIGMDDVADEGGFIVAYLNGSRATNRNEKFLAWNAGGGCCGQPFEKNVDDVGYISRAVAYLTQKYGVDAKKIYGMGHSNGAMMTQRLMCEADIYQAAIPLAGPLNIDVASCPKAKGKKIWAIHGANDLNLPVAGGKGTKGISNVDFKSQAYSKSLFESSGAVYNLDILPGTEHSLQSIGAAIEKRSGRTLGREAALYFGLAPK